MGGAHRPHHAHLLRPPWQPDTSRARPRLRADRPLAVTRARGLPPHRQHAPLERDPLKLPKALLDRIQAHARAGAPQEVCGILAGRRAPDGTLTAEHAFPIRNVHPNPVTGYLLDPQEQLQTVLHVEDDLRLEVVGFYHSHPAGPPRLSATDIAKATWQGTSYFLVWLAPTEGYGCWIWQGREQGFAPEPVDLT